MSELQLNIRCVSSSPGLLEAIHSAMAENGWSPVRPGDRAMYQMIPDEPYRVPYSVDQMLNDFREHVEVTTQYWSKDGDLYMSWYFDSAYAVIEINYSKSANVDDFTNALGVCQSLAKAAPQIFGGDALSSVSIFYQ